MGEYSDSYDHSSFFSNLSDFSVIDIAPFICPYLPSDYRWKLANVAITRLKASFLLFMFVLMTFVHCHCFK